MLYGQDIDNEKSLIDKGLYQVLLSDIDLVTEDKLGFNLDHHKVKITFQIVGPKHQGKKLWLNLIFKDTTQKFLAWQLGVLGVWKQLKDVTSHEEAAKKAANELWARKGALECTVEVSHREYQGSTYENVIVKSGSAETSPPNYANQVVDQASKKAELPMKGLDTSEELPF